MQIKPPCRFGSGAFHMFSSYPYPVGAYEKRAVENRMPTALALKLLFIFAGLFQWSEKP
jgi:hypothetical protein